MEATMFETETDARNAKHLDMVPIAARATNPMEILALLAERDAGVDVMERAMAMAERFQDREAERLFNEAMAACQAELPSVIKDKQGQHSFYAQLETISEAAMPVINKHGFALSFYQGASEKPEMIHCMVDVMHSAGHTKTRFMDLPRDGSGPQGGKTAMNPIQGVGSTHSYAQRYLMVNVFNIRITGLDNDAQWNKGTINDDQINIINKLIVEVKKVHPEWVEGPFLNWLAIAKIEDMTPGMFAAAVNDLSARRKKAGAK